MLPLKCLNFKKIGSNSKPATSNSFLRNSAIATRNTRLFVWISVSLLVFTGFRLRNTNTRKESNGEASSNALRGSLPEKSINVPHVCSHQLLNAPSSDAVDGSLSALRSFWTAGVHCFDIDIVTLQDGNLLAAHPSRLAKATNGGKADEHTLNSIRRAGADPTAFPLLSEVLNEYAGLIKASLETGKEIPATFLNLDLKGPNLTKDLLTSIVHQIYKLQIQDYVVFCVTALRQNETGPGVDVLQTLTEPSTSKRPVQLGLVLRDRVEEDWDVKRIKKLIQSHGKDQIRFLVPSFKFSSAWFQDVQKHVGLSVAAWTIDTLQDWEDSKANGVTAVIANSPMDLVPQSTRIATEA